MKIVNHKQLLIILRPKYNYPIICKLIINQLRKKRFKNKQNKLLNNLLKYKARIQQNDKELTRFELLGHEFYNKVYEDYLYSDNSKYKGYSVEFNGDLNLYTCLTLIDMIFIVSLHHKDLTDIYEICFEK